ncbi:MAG: hypothetical protein RIA69_04205 [Cyclobacteriaceae bacterium]
MKKVIIIGMNNKFSTKVNRWFSILTGLLFIVNGTMNIYRGGDLKLLGIILGILMLAGACYYLFYGILGFAENSKFSPKVKVDESEIELKNSLWKPSQKLHWADLSTIHFQSYQILFELKDQTMSFSYHANPDVSKEIKQTIREFAEQKGIQVVGG